jgi:osmoprotectant transport system ATP-binding protein
MDEPFGALDPLTRDEMQELVLKLLRDAPRTLLMVTHDLNEALRLATRIVLMDKGEVVVDVPANEFSRSTEPMVQKYLRAFRPATAEAAHG